MYLRFNDNKIIVSAPTHVDLTTILNFIDLKAEWIYQQYLKNSQKVKAIDLQAQTIYILGKKYQLNVYEHVSKSWILNDDELNIYLRTFDEKKLLKYLDKILASLLEIAIDPLIAKWNSVFNLRPTIKIKALKSKWGMCYHQDNLIVLSTYLAHNELKAIDAVILHEYVHFLVPNHSPNFYQIVYNYMRDYDHYKKILIK